MVRVPSLSSLAERLAESGVGQTRGVGVGVKVWMLTTPVAERVGVKVWMRVDVLKVSAQRPGPVPHDHQPAVRAVVGKDVRGCDAPSGGKQGRIYVEALVRMSLTNGPRTGTFIQLDPLQYQLHGRLKTQLDLRPRRGEFLSVYRHVANFYFGLRHLLQHLLWHTSIVLGLCVCKHVTNSDVDFGQRFLQLLLRFVDRYLCIEVIFVALNSFLFPARAVQLAFCRQHLMMDKDSIYSQRCYAHCKYDCALCCIQGFEDSVPQKS
ncbi:hypothetical protein KC341_g77 [Hortaea werneckii]|nr:hypothetical protein KC341_g77 [Hortaea werneckii]